MCGALWPDQPIIWFWIRQVCPLARAGDVPGAREALTHAESSPLLHSECLQLRASLAVRDGNGDPIGLLREAATTTADQLADPQEIYRGSRRRHCQLAEARTQIARSFSRRIPSRVNRGSCLERSWSAPRKRIWHGPDVCEEAALRDVRDEEARNAGRSLAEGKR